MTNDLTLAKDALTVLTGALTLVSKLGIDLHAVSEAIDDNHGQPMSAEQLHTFIQAWQSADKRENAAYKARMDDA
jgi:hypothetical protein